MKRMNEKWNYALHEHYYVYGVLYSRLKSKSISIDSRLATLPIKTKIKKEQKQKR